MTTISETAPVGARNRRHAGLWHRTTQALGKLWAKVIALPEARSATEVPPESWRFPPF
jgi:hypothetical protein